MTVDLLQRFTQPLHTLGGLLDLEVPPVWDAALWLVVGGLGSGVVIDRGLRRGLTRLPEERAMLVRRVVVLAWVGAFLAAALSTVGYDLTVLLGAAGVLTVALGFASQTSASNIISGLFLIAERPFSVGDWVIIGTTEGEVLAIDVLSVRIRTFQNTYVRVPNETVMKSEIINVTRFPIRRIDIELVLAPDVDPEPLLDALIAQLDKLQEVLDEPRPRVLAQHLSAAGLHVKLTAWATRESALAAKLQALVTVRRVLTEADTWFGADRVRLIDPGAS